MSNGDTQEYVEAPMGWRVAIGAFDSAGFTHGSEISKSWLYEAFGIEEPKPQTSLKQAQELNLRFLASFKEFERYLLSERSMAFQTQWGKGYRIVFPTEQTEWAQTEFERAMKKTFSRAAERLVNIDHNQLTEDQSTENANALARVGSARALLTGNRRLSISNLNRLSKNEDS